QHEAGGCAPEAEHSGGREDGPPAGEPRPPADQGRTRGRVKPLAIDDIRTSQAAPRREADALHTGPASRFWLRLFFRLARSARWLLKVIKPLGIWFAVRCSKKIRRATQANARRIFGPAADAACAE